MELEELRKEYQIEIEKINSITDVLNKHTSILTENSATFAKIQAITNQNSERIDEVCKQLFNQEARITAIEGRLDKIEFILNEHRKALDNIVGEIAEMKSIINDIIKRVEALESQAVIDKVENKKEKIDDFIERFDEEGLYEFADFINGLRGQNVYFNLEKVIKGAKIILEKHKKNYKFY